MIVTLALMGLIVSIALAQEPPSIVGTAGDDVLPGTPAPDSIYGGAGNDFLLGGAGDDELDGGPGADGISGGPDRDSVSYAGAPVTVTLDGVANDGAAGEGDNIAGDVEDVFGSDGPDKLAGSGAENTLDGNAGDDTITGGSGSDGLFGGDGDDRITSRDGSVDRVDCGPGIDVAIVDARDSVRDCEEVGRNAVTENFQLAKVLPFAGPRVRTLRLANVATGSRVSLACISGCRPRSPRTRRILRRKSVTSSGASRIVLIRLKRSPLAAGATFEIGVKAKRARARCRRFRLTGPPGQVRGVAAPKTRCTSVVRNG